MSAPASRDMTPRPPTAPRGSTPRRMTPRESPRAQSAERAPRAPLSAREAREGPRSTPRLPSPNSRGRARKLRASLGTPNITTHVMGYTGHVPGNQDSMGTNLRSWIYRNSAGKPRPRPYSAGVQQPILGYTGHVPGIIHHSKFNSFHDSAQSCWDEAAPLIRTPRPEELYAEPYCVPPKSQRGWIPFLSTNRADYVDHWKSEHVYTLHCPERPFVEDDRADDIPSHIHGYKIIKDPKEVCTVLDSKTLYAEKWLSEDDPAGGRKTVDLFAALRAKARARIPSGGEIRKSFYYFTGYRSNTISFPAWCKALQLLGLGPIMRKSDAERLFKIADKNGDGKIQFAEFVRHVMGRSHDPTSGEAQSMLHERFLVTSSAPS